MKTLFVTPQTEAEAILRIVNTYGWSGAYGTHFYIDPENDLTVTLGVNCSNIGGADSPFSKDVEKIMMEEFCKVV